MGKLEDALAGSGFPAAMPEVPELTVPQQMACAARMLAADGYALDVAGHITVNKRDDNGEADGSLWCTPYGLWWQELTASDIIRIDGDGAVIEGRWDVTPAVFIHTELHRARPDAEVIVHNHPYYGSLLSTLHVTPEITDQQACAFDGDIVLFDEYTGGVDDAGGGRHLADAVGHATAVILANHGVLVTGSGVAQATYRATLFERMCQLNYDAMVTGHKPIPVPTQQRSLIKRSINTLSVDYYWGGRIRALLAAEPNVLD